MLGGCGTVPTTPPAGGTEASTVDSGAKCNTTFYNADYAFGFDLPSNADTLIETPDALFSRGWAFTFAGVRIGVSTRVEASPPVPLADYVTGLSQHFSDVAGWETLSADAVQLSDGIPAYFVIMTPRVDGDLMWDYSLYTIVGPFLYRLSASGAIEDLDDVVSDEASRILESLCIE